jgi:hypothetical protein
MSPTAPARLAGRSRPPSLFDYDRPSLLMRRSHKTRCSQPGRPSPRSWARGGKKGVERDERRLARTPETADRRAALEEGTRTVPSSRRPRRPSGRPWRSSRATSPSSCGCLSERRRGGCQPLCKPQAKPTSRAHDALCKLFARRQALHLLLCRGAPLARPAVDDDRLVGRRLCKRELLLPLGRVHLEGLAQAREGQR